MIVQISLEEAFEEVANGGQVYVLTRMTGVTTVADLQRAAGLCMVAPDDAGAEPEPEDEPEEPTEETPRGRNGQKPDHGKICALYKAGWSCTKIADEIGCSTQTVVNHLNKEGIYKGGK